MPETKDTASSVATEASAADSFMQRICKAFDGSPRYLSDLTGIPLKDIMAVWKGGASEIIAIDVDPMWTVISDHVDARIGALMSVRAEFQAKLDKDRKRRAARRQRILNR